MSKRIDKLSSKELQALLYERKRTERQARLQRLKAEGRVVDAAELAEPLPVTPPPLPKSQPPRQGAWRRYTAEPNPSPPTETESQPIQWRWVMNKLLLVVEIGAAVAFIGVVIGMFASMRQLNADAALAQQQAAQQQTTAVPTPTSPPLISLAVLPSGHKPPIDGRPPEQGEAGDIPAHLLPLINAYVPPAVPTPSPQHARTVQIEAIGVNHSVVQGDDWEQLKKGIGHHIGSALPGQTGNMVLSAHNDIYGEIFRHLDELTPGDEIVINTDRNTFQYIVTDIRVVAPTDTWVLEPTEHASLTLISCYPYLVNNKRIVVFGDLIEIEAESEARAQPHQQG